MLGPVYIEGFAWLPSVVEKLAAKHDVSTDEVEDLFYDLPRYRFVEAGEREGENLLSIQGQTEAGRYLIAFFIHKRDRSALIISARDMTVAERRRYDRK